MPNVNHAHLDDAVEHVLTFSREQDLTNTRCVVYNLQGVRPSAMQGGEYKLWSRVYIKYESCDMESRKCRRLFL